MSVTDRDLKAAEANRRQVQQLVNGGLAPVLEANRRQVEAVIGMLSAVNAMAPVLRNYRQTAAIAMQLAAVAAPAWAVPASPPQSRVATTVPSINWLFLGQYTLRVLFAAIVIAVIYAAWQEQKESAPALALLEILGALWTWYAIDEKIWKRLS